MIDRHSGLPEGEGWIASVVDENSDALLRYFRRRVMQPEDAADLLARTMLTLWENGAKIPRTATDARMWCFGIARNMLREHYRHAAQRLALADELREHLRVTVQLENSAESVAEVHTRDAEVRAAVFALDTRSRELVMLVHWDGLSIAEAARLLSMNTSTARTRYGRAIRRLEQTLHEHRPSKATDRTLAQPGPMQGSH